ncbi:RNA polymerase III RPC4-domain-containing protein [Cladorrhinum sp. PSN332]|nr:RNA polymerase III RPC4-domain-containing protein [Cladorrhinum sp. PSN332]
MPPKATPRGRGRGRGGTARGASATAATSASASGSASASQQSAPESDATGGIPTPTPAASALSEPRSAAATPAPTSSAPVPAAQRFKPKAIRASQQERLRRAEEIDKQEALRMGQDAKRDSRLRGRGGRGSRGRGNLMNRSFRSAPAAGPLSSGTYRVNGEGPAGVREYGVASGRAFSHVKSEGEQGGPKDSRINADTLYYSSTPFSYVPGMGDKKNPILPIGIRRFEHKTEGAKTNEDNEAKEEDSDEEGLFVDDGKGSSSKAEDVDGYKAANSPRIKKEGGEDGMGVDLSQIPEGDGDAPKPLASAKKKAPVFKAKGPKTPKEIEDELKALDVEKMVGLLSLSQQPIDGQSVSEGRPRSMLDGHMFHFQFPPVMPPLHPVSEDVGTKPEVDDDEDTVMLEQGGKNKGKAPAVTVDLTKDVKIEDGAEDDSDDDGDDDDDDDLTGYVGKLIVRKSGKVELDWGGHRMELGMGIERSYFTAAALIDMEEEKSEDTVKDPQASSGITYSMGRVQGSFTVTTIWSPIQPWVVDPKDLEVS